VVERESAAENEGLRKDGAKRVYGNGAEMRPQRIGAPKRIATFRSHGYT
jgi:hypothetical protein